MKAYVIKNKEGEYYDFWANCFCVYFDSTCIYLEKRNAENEIIINEDCKDCEVVEITIAEGDIEKENRVLRKALRNAVINADFYKYGSQSTTDENVKRILRLEEQYIQQAKESIDED